jgi:hypothetical protein
VNLGNDVMPVCGQFGRARRCCGPQMGWFRCGGNTIRIYYKCWDYDILVPADSERVWGGNPRCWSGRTSCLQCEGGWQYTYCCACEDCKFVRPVPSRLPCPEALMMDTDLDMNMGTGMETDDDKMDVNWYSGMKKVLAPLPAPALPLLLPPSYFSKAYFQKPRKP